MTSREQRERLRDIIGHGLVGGLGSPRPGELCVEAAVCLALGEPHGDEPSCVAKPDLDFAIRLNDAAWSSASARAEALLPLALAQLGTAGSDRTAWVRRVVEGTIRRVLPLALRAAAAADSLHREALLTVADRCEADGSADAADAAYVAALAAFDDGVDGAYALRAASASALRAASADADADAVYDAVYAAYDAAYAVNAAACAASAAARDADQVLRVAVDVALDAYRAERGAVDDLWMDADGGES